MLIQARLNVEAFAVDSTMNRSQPGAVFWLLFCCRKGGVKTHILLDLRIVEIPVFMAVTHAKAADLQVLDQDRLRRLERSM